MKCKYDVFISYSRNDYEGVDKIIIPGNPISKIQVAFEKNGISYWFDKDGIYSSQKFIKVISDAIANSYILVFVSSVHSNDSEYTALEINDAFRKKKKIISVKIDECEFNDDFGIILNSVDYIDYFVNPDVALEELIRSINKIKEKIALEEIEEEAKKIDDNKKKIKKQTQIYCTWKSRIDSTIRELIKLNESIGNTTKECPVCGSECSISDVFCEYCGWSFSSIYALSEDCNQTENEELLALCKVNYELIINGSADNEKTKRLENECEELREKIHNFESRQKDWDSEKKELSAKIQTLEESQKVFDGEKNALTARIHELEKQQKDWSSKEENFLNQIIQLKSEHTKSELGKVKDNSVISKISHFINKSFNELDIEE